MCDWSRSVLCWRIPPPLSQRWNSVAYAFVCALSPAPLHPQATIVEPGWRGGKWEKARKVLVISIGRKEAIRTELFHYA